MNRTFLAFLVLGCTFWLGYQLGKINPQTFQRERITASTLAATATAPSGSHNLAYEESLHFFDDYADQEWERIKLKVREIQPNTKGSPRSGPTISGAWFQNHYEPDFACRHERRIGKLGDGGKWVCDPHRLQGGDDPGGKPPSCLVYSVGSNGDSSFELAVKTSIGQHCEIHTFDMDNYSTQVEPTGALYHQWGLADTTQSKKEKSKGGEMTIHEYKTLADTVKLLGHQNRTIDIFKIDCEGCEWSTWRSWFDAKVPIRQVLIEVHENAKRVPRHGAPDFFSGMYQQGYVIFHKEPNIHYWHYRKCVEYAFLLLNQTFFDDENGTSWLKLQ